MSETIIPIVLLLVVCITLGWITYDEYRQAQESEYRLLEAHARNADAKVADALHDINNLLTHITDERLKNRSLQDNAFAAELHRHRKDIPELGALLLTDATGRIRSSTDATLVGRDISRETYFAVHRAPGRAAKLFMSRPDKNLLGVPAVTFTLPIIGPNREFLGIAATTIGFRFFPHVLHTINPDDSASMSVIFNRDGDLVYRRSNPEKFFGNNIAKVSKVFYDHYKTGMQVTRHIGPSAHDGKTRLFVVRRVGDTGLGLILSRQRDEVLAVWLRNTVVYASICVFTFVIVFLLAVAARRRKLLEADIVAAKQRAEDANLAKSKFLAAASHDLRQPIHAQGLFLDVLARTELSTYQREVLARANAASKSSVDMLNTLLDFSRIEAGVVEPCVQAFRLQPLFNKLEREFVSQADAKGLAYRSRETILEVQSDPMLVELILRNLISNAIRYTDRGGLLVACRKRGDQAVLEIWDTGIGIAPSHQQAVFREFHQLGNPEHDHRKGLGLGLAIVDGLARTLEHKLSVVSTPQRGSVFRLSLPIAVEVPPAEDHEPAQPGEQAPNMRVLVLDDDEIVRTGMLHLLRDWGFECDVAESIEEALALAQAHAPDLLICDYLLREPQTGLDAIAALRTVLGETLPAMLITGNTTPDLLNDAQAGGIPLLHKPVSPGQLQRVLLTMLDKTG
ncbi:MAG: ATP-binding protein [Gallionella sp.]|nr:ATP-binding protein [Gallionella sp.]